MVGAVVDSAAEAASAVAVASVEDLVVAALEAVGLVAVGNSILCQTAGLATITADQSARLIHNGRFC